MRPNGTAEDVDGDAAEELLDGRFRVEPWGSAQPGRGEVLFAHDEELGRHVVLKRSDPGEARAYAKVAHRHVVTVYNVLTVPHGERAGTWLVMEHAPNGSLAGVTMTPVEAARVGARIAGALATLHRAGLVHCDVKPANIVVDRDGVPKLTDFDAAHRLGGVETISPERPISYTRDYAAPELIGGNPVPASDVFCLGATLYALVTGVPPRPWAHGEPDGPDSGDRRIAAVRARRGSVEMAADVGPLRDTLAAMLAADPDRRPTAAEARALLRRVAHPSPRRRALTAAVRRWRPVTAAAGAVALGAAAVVWWPGQDPAPRSVIGDERTADPCALLDPGTLARFGDVELDRAYGNFDRCDAIVDPAGEPPVDVEVLFDQGPFGEGDEPGEFEGEIGIVALDEDADSCERGLTLPEETDDTIVVITVDYANEDGATGLCEMADTAARSAAAALEETRAAGEEIPRRSFPENSLARLDACTLLDADALAAVIPGVDVTEPEPGFAHWKCAWSSTSDPLRAVVRFDQNDALSGDDGRPTLIGGRDAFVTPLGDGDGSCTVRVEHRSFTGRRGTDKTEMLRVAVITEDPGHASGEELCETALTLATSATAALPPP
ncbi:protein kinase domain-containing protein [Streptomyces sp. URMC 129]|uniref:serine/threonine-protein kinase n=1 Tax=Streptomyces sp. URMC 129 TaxID=3423407 RepID=UPI003F1C4FE2